LPNRGVLAPKGASKRLGPFTKERGGIYRLILGFQRCQVSLSALDHTQVRSIALMHEFLHLMGTSALDHSMCTRVHILQNWPNLVRYDFVYLRVSFPKTPRSPQSKFYNSRYGHFGGTHWVRIIARPNFAAKAPRTVLSPILMALAPNVT
jgi:hypothetical protein